MAAASPFLDFQKLLIKFIFNIFFSSCLKGTGQFFLFKSPLIFSQICEKVLALFPGF